MQPEQPYYAHHPGRFFYLKDEDNGALYSAPYEPVRAAPTRFTFSAGRQDVAWEVEYDGIVLELRLQLPEESPVELWQCTVRNRSGRPRRVSL
ncbi:hypothetical protein R0J87_19630, partial [Halomonas sp. SIMBA_159]